MFRRVAFAAFAVAAVLQTGCHGRVSAFFYRLTHCGCCTPHYGEPAGYAAPVYGGYGHPGTCCSAPAPVAAYPAVATYPAAGTPVFTGTPQPMPAPSVYPTPPAASSVDPTKK